MSRYLRKRVLFICIGNACRSPMAEAIARVDAFDTIDAFSAGLAPIGFVPEMTKQTLTRNGYSVEGLESKRVWPNVLQRVDLIINMSGRPWELPFDEHSEVEDWDIEDPHGEDPDTYQRVFEEIRLRVAKLAQKCRDDAAPSAQASQSNLRKHLEWIWEQENARLETPNAPRPGSMPPRVSTFGEIPDRHGEVAALSPAAAHSLNTAEPPITAPRTYTRTAMPLNKTAVRPGRRLAGDQGSPGALRRRGNTLLVLGFLAGFIVLTMIKLITIQHNSPSEMIADVTKKLPELSEAMKPSTPPPVTTTPKIANPPANKTQPVVEPLSIEEVERIIGTAPKHPPRPTNAAKKPLPATAVKTLSDHAERVLTRSQPAKALPPVATNVNISPVKKTPQQTPSSPPPAPPQMEAKIEQLANPARLASHEVRAPEPESKPTSAPAANQPATPANVTAAVAILADPYPSLRIPDGNPKKQRKGMSLQLGHLVSRVEPVYPEDAKHQGIQGAVKLHAIIDRHGAVQNLQSVNGPSVLVAAAMNAVRQWRFSETLLAGQSVETEEDIDIVFRLSNSGAPRK
jgi:TonB family protein